MNPPPVMTPGGPSAGSLRLDQDNPWPGLAPFTEESNAFFFGREREAAELARLVEHESLVVLYGQSGLGKTSLLQAGLFPRLRASHHLPVPLRLAYGPGSPPLTEQVKQALTHALDAAHVEGPRPAAADTLWECLHRADADFWSPRNQLLVPVLVFDQFEEFFTLGRRDADLSRQGQVFVEQLAGLVEHRPPPALQAQLDARPELAANFNFDQRNFRVLIALREDFLPELEALQTHLRALGRNRLRLQRLAGAHALDVVLRPGGHLVEQEVAEQIVDFVSATRTRGEAVPLPLAERQVEPALLSVVCCELNHRRRQLGQPRITAGLLTGARVQIITDFYERAFAGVPEPVRAYLESELLTSSGYRDRVAFEDAVASGVSEETIATLVNRRLLHREETGVVIWLELSHDLLCAPAQKSRSERLQRERLAEVQARAATAIAAAQRARRVAILTSVVCLLAVLGLAGSLVLFKMYRASESIRLQEELNQQADRRETARARISAELAGIERLQIAGDDRAALARLAELAEGSPADELVIRRLLEALEQRHWVPCRAPAVATGFHTNDAEFFALDEAGDLRFWTFWRGAPIGEPWNLGTAVELAAVSPDGLKLAVAGPDSEVRLYDLFSRKLRARFPHTARINHLAFSPNNRWLAVAVGDWRDEFGYTQVWDTESGQAQGRPLPHHGRVVQAVFSPDSQLIATGAWDWTARVWKSETGEPVCPPLVHEAPVNAICLVSSTALLTGGDDGYVLFWNLDHAAADPEPSLRWRCHGPLTALSWRGGDSNSTRSLDFEFIATSLTADQQAEIMAFAVAQQSETIQLSDRALPEPVYDLLWLRGPTQTNALLRGVRSAFFATANPARIDRSIPAPTEDRPQGLTPSPTAGTDAPLVVSLSASLRNLQPLRHGGAVTATATNPRLATTESWAKDAVFPLLTASEDGTVRVWESSLRRRLTPTTVGNENLPLLPTNSTRALARALELAGHARQIADGRLHEATPPPPRSPATNLTWAAATPGDRVAWYLDAVWLDQAEALSSAAKRAWDAGHPGDAIASWRRNLAAYQQRTRLAPTDASTWYQTATAQGSLALALLRSGQTAEGRQQIDGAVRLLDSLIAAPAPDEESRGRRDAAAASATWWNLFARRPDRVVALAESVLRPGLAENTRRIVYMNLAHACLYLGRFEQAATLYRANAPIRLNDRSFGDYVLQDFRELTEAGLPPPRLDEMRQLTRRALAEAEPAKSP